MLFEPLEVLEVCESFTDNLLNATRYVRTMLNKREERGSHEEDSKLASIKLLEVLKSIGISSSIHHGWAVYDKPDEEGNRFTGHWYCIAKHKHDRVYLDIWADNLNDFLTYKAGTILILPIKPYWFRNRRPCVKELERVSNKRIVW